MAETKAKNLSYDEMFNSNAEAIYYRSQGFSGQTHLCCRNLRRKIQADGFDDKERPRFRIRNRMGPQ